MKLINHVCNTSALVLLLGISACGADNQSTDKTAPPKAITNTGLTSFNDSLTAGKTVGDIFNFHRVEKGVLYRSGQVQRNEFQLLKDFGIKTIISLSNYEVTGFPASDERRWAEAKGILFLHEEMHPWARPSMRHLQRIAELIKNSEKPVLVHCHGGSDRTGMAIAAYKMIYEGMPYDAAYQEMLYYGFNRVEYNWQDVLNYLP